MILFSFTQDSVSLVCFQQGGDDDNVHTVQVLKVEMNSVSVNINYDDFTGIVHNG